MTVSGIQNTNIYYNDYTLQKDNTNVNMPLFYEKMPCKMSAAHKRYLETKNLSTREQISKGIDQICMETGLSENYVKMLMNEEELRLEIYDDGVKNNESDEHGTYTIGYGHTGTVPGWMFDNKIHNNKKYEITQENKNHLQITTYMAMELLLEDLKNVQEDAINYFGKDNFNNAPQSIRDAIVDIIFNKGIKAFKKEGSPTTHLKKDLENKDYVSAATHTIYETPIMGLKIRNLKRFAHAVKDLTTQEKQKAKKQTQEYYESVSKDIKQKQIQYKTGIKNYHKWIKYNLLETKADIIWNSIDGK